MLLCKWTIYWRTLSSKALVHSVAQVHDVKMQNEYNLQLKDAAMKDKVRELTERRAADVGQAEARLAALQQETEEQRVQYEAKLQEAAEHQQVLQHTVCRVAIAHVPSNSAMAAPPLTYMSLSVTKALLSCNSSMIVHM